MYIVLGLVSSLSMIFFLDRENKARDRGERDEVIGGGQGDDQTNGRFATVSDAKREKGDAWSGYRYTLWSVFSDWCRLWQFLWEDMWDRMYVYLEMI